MKICPVCQREYASGQTHCTDDGVALVGLNTGSDMRPEELIGQTVEGRYKIERIIGKGGMGTVYACRHVVVGKTAAIKVLRTGVERSDGVLQRFIREAQTANSIKSRHIAEVADFGQLPNGSFFVVMELLEGEDLAHAMRNNRLTRTQMINVFVQVAETLQLAHDKGIVHRDLKPDNVFLVTEDGNPHFVKLLDFGIAKVMHGDSSGGLTETGVILGTPYYMSPEQARAEAIDHRSDIYALGVMMYRAFTGRLPFMADSTMGVLTRHLTEAPELPSRITNVDPATERMILLCMEKRRENRVQSMRDLAETLKRLPTSAPSPIRDDPTVHERRGTPGPTPAPMSYPSGAYPGALISGAFPGAQGSGSYPGAQGSGSYPGAQASGSYPGAQASGSYPGAQASGSYPGAQVSGAYPGAQVSGAYPGAQVSGAHPAPVAYPSGAHPMHASGGHPAAVSGPHAPPPTPSYPGSATPGPMAAHDPRSTSGPHQASGAHAAMAGFDPRASGPPGSTPYPGAQSIGGEIGTTRGLAAPSVPAAAPKRGAGLVIGGALLMLAVGAGGAVLVYRGPSNNAPVAPAGAANTAAATTTATAADAPTAAATATATAAASAPAATASATADAAASAAPAAVVKPRGGGTRPAATATSPAKRPGTEIRSPFD